LRSGIRSQSPQRHERHNQPLRSAYSPLTPTEPQAFSNNLTMPIARLKPKSHQTHTKSSIEGGHAPARALTGSLAGRRTADDLRPMTCWAGGCVTRGRKRSRMEVARSTLPAWWSAASPQKVRKSIQTRLRSPTLTDGVTAGQTRFPALTDARQSLRRRCTTTSVSRL